MKQGEMLKEIRKILDEENPNTSLHGQLYGSWFKIGKIRKVLNHDSSKQKEKILKAEGD